VDCLVIADKVLMVEIDWRTQSNSEDKGEYCCDKQNAHDKSGDNASSGSVVIADQSTARVLATLGQDVIVIQQH